MLKKIVAVCGLLALALTGCKEPTEFQKFKLLPFFEQLERAHEIFVEVDKLPADQQSTGVLEVGNHYIDLLLAYWPQNPALNHEITLEVQESYPLYSSTAEGQKASHRIIVFKLQDPSATPTTALAQYIQDELDPRFISLIFDPLDWAQDTAKYHASIFASWEGHFELNAATMPGYLKISPSLLSKLLQATDAQVFQADPSLLHELMHARLQRDAWQGHPTLLASHYNPMPPQLRAQFPDLMTSTEAIDYLTGQENFPLYEIEFEELLTYAISLKYELLPIRQALQEHSSLTVDPAMIFNDFEQLDKHLHAAQVANEVFTDWLASLPPEVIENNQITMNYVSTQRSFVMTPIYNLQDGRTLGLEVLLPRAIFNLENLSEEDLSKAHRTNARQVLTPENLQRLLLFQQQQKAYLDQRRAQFNLFKEGFNSWAKAMEAHAKTRDPAYYEQLLPATENILSALEVLTNYPPYFQAK